MSSTDAACILVVDDDDDVREAVVSSLEDEGYAVISQRDGPSAIACLRAQKSISLMLLDWNMAPMNAYEVIEELRMTRVPVPPVVVFSADAPKDKVGRVGAVGFLKKPVPLDELYRYAATYCPRR